MCVVAWQLISNTHATFSNPPAPHCVSTHSPSAPALLLRRLPCAPPGGPSRCQTHSGARSSGCPAAACCRCAAQHWHPTRRLAPCLTGKTSGAHTAQHSTAQHDAARRGTRRMSRGPRVYPGTVPAGQALVSHARVNPKESATELRGANRCVWCAAKPGSAARLSGVPPTTASAPPCRKPRPAPLVRPLVH